jgi:hypothetical protein
MSAYAVIWKLLYTVGLRAIPAHVARAKMKEGIAGDAAYEPYYPA